MAVTSLAVIGYFRTASGEESPWTAYVAPALGFAGLVTAIYLSLHNFDTLTGVTSGPVTYLPWLIPIAALIGARRLVGEARAALRRHHPGAG
jgi:hypothetical protein